MDMAAAAIWISLAACLTGFAGLLLKYDRRNEEEALWRGEVNGKLDVACGVRRDVDALKQECGQNARGLAVVEASVKSAHHRLDEITHRPCCPETGGNKHT